MTTSPPTTPWRSSRDAYAHFELYYAEHEQERHAA